MVFLHVISDYFKWMWSDMHKIDRKQVSYLKNKNKYEFDI